jgi:hypothetical protein
LELRDFIGIYLKFQIKKQAIIIKYIIFGLKIEIANGAHPYKGQNFFQQINTIDTNEPPGLINGSAELSDFLKNWFVLE